jgi:hypothetical protein
MADLLAGAVAIALIFWWLQYSTSAICCGDYDGYYHIKWARLLGQHARWPFPAGVSVVAADDAKPA